MGRASRWLANLLGWKKPDSSDSKPKKWRFGKSYREKKEKGGAPPQVPQVKVEMAEEKRGSYREVVDAEDDSKRAIAVAAATAKAAEVAVAAAQAAVAVVKLTSGGRMVKGGGRKEEWAAVKIQSVFRGYLVRNS